MGRGCRPGAARCFVTGQRRGQTNRDVVAAQPRTAPRDTFGQDDDVRLVGRGATRGRGGDVRQESAERSYARY